MFRRHPSLLYHPTLWHLTLSYPTSLADPQPVPRLPCYITLSRNHSFYHQTLTWASWCPKRRTIGRANGDGLCNASKKYSNKKNLNFSFPHPPNFQIFSIITVTTSPNEVDHIIPPPPAPHIPPPSPPRTRENPTLPPPSPSLCVEDKEHLT